MAGWSDPVVPLWVPVVSGDVDGGDLVLGEFGAFGLDRSITPANPTLVDQRAHSSRRRRRAMPGNAQSSAELHGLTTLVRLIGDQRLQRRFRRTRSWKPPSRPRNAHPVAARDSATSSCAATWGGSVRVVERGIHPQTVTAGRAQRNREQPSCRGRILVRREVADPQHAPGTSRGRRIDLGQCADGAGARE
jgi:hypothetical protein